jgi:hypothetical protein
MIEPGGKKNNIPCGVKQELLKMDGVFFIRFPKHTTRFVY